MRKNLSILITAISLFVAFSPAFSGAIKDEFYKTMNDLKNTKTSPESRKKQLEETLLVSLQSAMFRFFLDPDANKIKTSDFTYEKSEVDANTYYIRYKDFVGYFTYSTSPELYLSLPIEQKLISKAGKTSMNNNSKKADTAASKNTTDNSTGK